MSKLYYLDENFYLNAMSSRKLLQEGNRLLRSATMRNDPKIVRLNGEVYAVGGYDNYKVTYVKKKINNDAWSMIGCNFHQRYGFCVCGFDGKLFIIGSYTHHEITNSCVEFDVKERKYSQICGMRVARSDAACAVYDGKIVVCGGVNRRFRNQLKSVECYDAAEDQWSPMPSMMFAKCGHRLVAVKKKLFAIDRGDCEIYDSYCRFNCEVYDNVSGKFVVVTKVPLLKEFNSILIALIERTGAGDHSYFGMSSEITSTKVVNHTINRKSFLREFFRMKN